MECLLHVYIEYNFIRWGPMKMKINLFILGLALFAFASCKNDVEDVNHRANTSSFEFSKISVVSMETVSQKRNWPDLKDTAIINLETCFVDTAYLENIVGEEFEISSSIGSHSKYTNAQGCTTLSICVLGMTSNT